MKCVDFRLAVFLACFIASSASYSLNLDERENEQKTTTFSEYYSTDDDASTQPPSVGEICISDTCSPGEVCIIVTNHTEQLTISEEVDEQLKIKSGIMVEYVGDSGNVEDYHYDGGTNFIGICACDSAHEYNTTLNRCVARNLTDGMIKEIYHTELDIRNEIKFAFLGVSVSIILFVSVMIIGVLAACGYCYTINSSDRKQRNELEALRRTVKNDPKKKSTGITTDPVPGPSKQEAQKSILKQSEYVPAIILI